MAEKWNPKMVAERMEEAANTLRRLKVSGLKPMGYGSAWPDIVHDFSEAYGYNDLVVNLGPPTAEAITRMDQAMEWLNWLEPDQVRLVWLHAEGVPRKVIMAKLGVQRTRVWIMWASIARHSRNQTEIKAFPFLIRYLKVEMPDTEILKGRTS